MTEQSVIIQIFIPINHAFFALTHWQQQATHKSDGIYLRCITLIYTVRCEVQTKGTKKESHSNENNKIKNAFKDSYFAVLPFG